MPTTTTTTTTSTTTTEAVLAALGSGPSRLPLRAACGRP